MDVQNGGIGLLGVKVLGAQHPAVQVDAVVCKGELLRQGHVGAGQGLLVEGSQLDALLGGLVPDVELLELQSCMPMKYSVPPATSMQSTEPSWVYTGRMSPFASRQNTWEASRMVATK